MRTAPTLVLDIAVVLVFAAVGRRNHAEADAALGVLTTAWPFLAGMAIGWLLAHVALRRAPGSVHGGIPVWLAAVAGGMLLRAATGEGTAPSFILVATLFLGACLIGWRLLVARFMARPA